ncbi:calsequestrin-1 [Parasteatoda tepidariorum]|uniref:calsequestrin-1 n=1 Tax=Parasteatoda tepidariorum TaxID=114398 RepID=UPI001C727C47|nr:calsequestrin-1 isoform X1 [Parasteatoda tepidariorum]
MYPQFVTLLLIFCTVHGSILNFLQTPKHDGVKRVCHLTAENFTNIVGAADTAVVIVKDLAVPKTTCPTETESFAEITAQVLRKKNSIVCEASVEVVSPSQSPDVSAHQAKPGDVLIYKKGKGVPYFGKRSTRALLNHLFKVNGTQVNIITGKIEKVAFDAVENVKLVGFFMQGTADYLAFEEAAARLSPSVTFYAAFDRVVAKHLKLTTVGEIQLIKPFSKTPIPCPQNPASAADIEALVNTNEGSILSKINEHNLYDPKLLDPNRYLVLAVGEEASGLGRYFFHLVTKLVRNNTNNTEFEKLNIVWVEPQIFPIIHLVMDELETTLGIPNKLPAFGALNITTLKSSWLDTSLLNCTSDKTTDAQNLLVLQEFLTGVVTNTLVPVKIGGQAFVQTPVSQTLEENSAVTLECVVENPIGDCLWIKDGRNIGYNLDRYQHYSWRGNHLNGDCSLHISSVQLARDSGEWVCEMTGDADSPTLTSPPAKLLVTAAPTGSATENVKIEL